MAVKLRICGQEYGLRMDMYAMEQIEEEFGGIREMFDEVKKGGGKCIRRLFRILANAHLAAEGREETVTGDEIKHLRVSAAAGISNAVRAAIEEGMRSEASGGNESDDEVYDVYLSELEAKN